MAQDKEMTPVSMGMQRKIVVTPEQMELVKKTIFPDSTDDELKLFFYECERRGVHPLDRMIFPIKRNIGESGEKRVVFQCSIDYFRSESDDAGDYMGMDEPMYEGVIKAPDGKEYPEIARVVVYKLVHGEKVPFTGVARWKEFYPGEKLGFMWRGKPYLMLGKCFSEDTEVFTDRGFKRFSEIRREKVMQVTENGLEPTDAFPFSQEWTGEMVTLDSNDLNFCVTPNHDMVTTEGKIEAGEMYEKARARVKFRIPRCVEGTRDESPISDEAIRLAAAYLADGNDTSGSSFRIEVSRPNKVNLLREIGLFTDEHKRQCAGDRAHTATRTIITKADKTRFVYAKNTIGELCESKTAINTQALLSLSRKQARLFVDTLVAFDGHTQKKTGVRRFYTSSPEILKAFEVACVVAGYSINKPKERLSDISTKPNYGVTVSDHSEIPVVRWGREYRGTKKRTKSHKGLTLTKNPSGRVWCVTVPSGVIVVRRNGFSMLCGNCAEAQARRLAWPKKFNKLYIPEEMQQLEPGATGVEHGQSTVKAKGAVVPEVVDDKKGVNKEDAITTLKREIGEYCGGDEAKMKEMLKKATLFNKDGKDVFVTDFSKLSLPWAGKALGAFRKLIKPAEAPEGCTNDPRSCDFSSFVDGKAMCGNNPCKPGEGKTY